VANQGNRVKPPQPSCAGSQQPAAGAVISKQRVRATANRQAHMQVGPKPAPEATPLASTIRAKGESAALQEATKPPATKRSELQHPLLSALRPAKRRSSGRLPSLKVSKAPARPTVTWRRAH